ncbi:hypothetical protein TVAG_553610 [Trichomonas vaginalis G3]|uniref:Uncharacterized protein n=1 Tax=Trichomonas vaginalis (strain ATCC PRA-98 / G3) TaxID=412133 RepID=A2HWU5_TRIV3|nr:hypothetical protein TVAG_553610 [Trichomonas vaginalis G3]|eukprot:XP_001279052.1 hypothetical protein [Trichomonas vaginalis G3]
MYLIVVMFLSDVKPSGKLGGFQSNTSPPVSSTVPSIFSIATVVKLVCVWFLSALSSNFSCKFAIFAMVCVCPTSLFLFKVSCKFAIFAMVCVWFLSALRSKHPETHPVSALVFKIFDVRSWYQSTLSLISLSFSSTYSLYAFFTNALVTHANSSSTYVLSAFFSTSSFVA